MYVCMYICMYVCMDERHRHFCTFLDISGISGAGGGDVIMCLSRASLLYSEMFLERLTRS